MPTYLLDTSVIIDTIIGKRGRRELLRQLLEHGNTLACCPINIAEVFAGMRPHEEANTTPFLQSLELQVLTFRISARAGALKRDYARQGKTLSLADLLIAATAIDNRLTLMTDNLKDFPTKDLLLYPLPR